MRPHTVDYPAGASPTEENAAGERSHRRARRGLQLGDMRDRSAGHAHEPERDACGTLGARAAARMGVRSPQPQPPGRLAVHEPGERHPGNLPEHRRSP